MTVLAKKVFTSSNPATVRLLCPPPRGPFSIQENAVGGLSYKVKKAVNPLYGKKGMGVINNPKKAAYNAVYNRTTVSARDIESSDKLTAAEVLGGIGSIFQLLFALIKVAFWLAIIIGIIAFLIWIF